MELNLFQPLVHVVTKFYLDGEEYDIEQFNIKFMQPIDSKGQPEHEVRGGQITITLLQSVDNTILDWAKRSTKLKSGEIKFESEMMSSVLTIDFENAYCIKLTRITSSTGGDRSVLVISPEIIKLNGVTHNNAWKKS